MKKYKISHLEIPIALGKTRMRNRLIIEMMPDNEVEKRIAKAAREGTKKGRQLSEEYKIRARLNLFITNVPAEWISTEKIRTVYRLRWQIELRFKAWKSFFHIDAIKKMQRHRFECYLTRGNGPSYTANPEGTLKGIAVRLTFKTQIYKALCWLFCWRP